MIEFAAGEGVGCCGAIQRVEHENRDELRVPPGDPQFGRLVREAVRESRSECGRGELSPEPAELATRLVKDGVLTAFQARQILKGKSQGLVFGRYVILDFLGKGGMGTVYKAWHRMMGRVVALKILDPQRVANSQSLARFRHEMQLVGRLDHPNVVRAFDADRVGEYHFIAMEYVAGQNLEDLMKERGALPPADVVYFASQAADGLAHAHALGILHRDIKPSNLLLTDARKVKILDFGLGTLLEKDELPAALTAAGITVGTPDYLSPEQARMVKLDGRSDLYSLGCTMYHLISGQLPFKGESSMDCIVGRITGKGIPISQVRPGLPPRLIQAIEKLMATNPDDRYQTAEETAAALRTLLRPKNLPADRPATTEAAVAPVVPKPVPKTTAAVTPVPDRTGPGGGYPSRDPFAAPPGRGSLVATEAGCAPLTVDRPRDEGQANPRRGRSRGGPPGRRPGRPLQVIEGRASGTPAGDLTHGQRPRPPEGRTSGTSAGDLRRQQPPRPPGHGGWRREPTGEPRDRKSEARSDGRHERGAHRADGSRGVAGHLRPGAHPRPTVVVSGLRREHRRREVHHRGRLR